MRTDHRIDAPSPAFHAPRVAWPALVMALAFGAVEWIALARSRGADRLGAVLRAVRHR